MRTLGEKKGQTLLIAMIMAAVGMFVTIMITPYTDTDNFYISLILNGLYSVEHYCEYLNPLLCDAAYALHRLLPSADGFVLLMRVVLFSVYSAFAYAILRHRERRALGIPVFGIIVFYCFTSRDYTITTAFFSAAGLYLLFSAKEEENGLRAMGAFTLCASFLFRTQAALLCVPYLGLECIRTLLRNRDSSYYRRIRRLGVCVIPSLCVIAGLLVYGYSVQHNALHQPGHEYNEVRTTIRDYPMRDWDEVSAVLPEVTENDYYSLQRMVLGDPERINTAYLSAIAEAGAKQRFGLSPQGFIGASRAITRAATKEKQPLLFTALTLLLFVYVLLSDRSGMDKLKGICVFGGSMLILYYFSFKGRVMGHIVQSVFSLCMACLLLVVFDGEAGRKAKRADTLKKIVNGLLAAAALLTAVLWFTGRTPNPAPALTAYADGPDILEGEENRTYVWEPWSFDHAVKRIGWRIGKMPTQAFVDHNVPNGEWTYGQSYMDDFLDSIDLKTPMKALLEREDTYYVAEDREYVETYLREHYDASITAVQVGKLYDIDVWSFREGVSSEE